jgi:hypothetical protein
MNAGSIKRWGTGTLLVAFRVVLSNIKLVSYQKGIKGAEGWCVN